MDNQGADILEETIPNVPNNIKTNQNKTIANSEDSLSIENQNIRNKFTESDIIEKKPSTKNSPQKAACKYKIKLFLIIGFSLLSFFLESIDLLVSFKDIHRLLTAPEERVPFTPSEAILHVALQILLIIVSVSYTVKEFVTTYFHKTKEN